MKRSLIKISLVLLFCQVKLFPQLWLSDFFEMKRISADFYGSASNGSSILVYGNGGVILRSTDKGNTWEQINLNDSMDIRQIFNINHTYYGNGSIGIIKSFDDGKTWNLHHLGDKIIKIFNYKGNVLCITRDNVLLVDTNISIIQKIKINLDWTYQKPSKESFWYYCVELFDDRLVFYSKKGKFGFLNLETGKVSEIILKNYTPKDNIDLLIHTDILQKGSDEIFFVYEHDVLSFNVYRDSLDYIYRIPDTINPKKLVFLPTNDTIYALFSYTNKVLNWDSYSYSPYLDSVYFGYIEPKSKKFVNIKEIENARSISDLFFTNLSIHKINGLEVFVAVGLGKLIYLSYDQGKNWNLISLLNIPFLMFNDFISSNFRAPVFVFGKSKARIITETGKFYASNDGGTTWLPQRNFLPKKRRMLFDFGVFLDSLRGIFFSDDPATLLPNNKIVIPPRLFYTFDGGETVNYRDYEIRNTINFLTEFITLLKPFNQCLIACSPAYFYYLDDSLKIKRQILHESKGKPKFKDSLIIFIDSLFFARVFEYKDTLWAISPVLVDYTRPFKYNKVNVCFSIDTGITWQKSFSFEIPNWPSTTMNTFSQYKDSLFLLFSQVSNSNPPNVQTLLVFLDLKNRSSKVFVKPFLLGDMILKLCNGYYLLYIKTEGLNAKQRVLFFDKWEGEKLNFQEFEINRFIINSQNSNPYYQTINFDPPDSVFAFVVNDNLFGSKALYFAKIRPCVELEVPRTNSKDFYISRPYPNPAEGSTKFRIYFNSSEGSETLFINAYDLLGRKVSDAGSFSITPLNSYSVEVDWRTVGLSPGVYVVVATLNGKASSNTVVVY